MGHTINTLNSTRLIQAQEVIPRRNSLCAPAETPNADGRLYNFSQDGIHSDGRYDSKFTDSN